MIPNILSIAGSDPSGGAGIQADIKAISASGGFAMAALTALTAQNTTAVTGVHPVPPDFVRQQIDTVFADVAVAAVKIGMVATAPIATAIAEALEAAAAAGHRPPVVLDPVMVASSGARLLDEDAIATVTGRLMPLATVVTPNLRELALLADGPTAADREAMAAQARLLVSRGAAAVLAKGGHFAADGGTEEGSPDLLLDAAGAHWIEGARVATTSTHGTGCSLASSLATHLALGRPLPEAAALAKAFVGRAIAAAPALSVGRGHGPIHHFHALGART